MAENNDKIHWPLAISALFLAIVLHIVKNYL